MHEIGECGSTAEVRRILARGGVELKELRDCGSVRAEMERRLGDAWLAAEQSLEQELHRLESALLEAEQQTTVELARRATELAAADANLDRQVTAAAEGPVPLRFLKSIGVFGAAAALEVRKAVNGRRETTALKDLAKRKQANAQFRERPQEWIRKQTGSAQLALESVKQGMDSEFYRGAIGEELVAHALRSLDDRHWVIHDVEVNLGHPITFVGQRVFKRQVDHVVVGPGGVHVIETKNWSHAHAFATSSRDPFRQAATAAHMIRCLLDAKQNGVRVRGIVANCGTLPPKSDQFYVDIKRPEDLVRAVTRRLDVLSDAQVQVVVSKLRAARGRFRPTIW